jgi:integrase
LPNNKNTRTANGAGSIRKREDGRWEGRVTVGIDPVTGKQLQRSVYGETQKEVRKQLSKITNEIDEKTYIDPCAMTLNEWLDIWLADYTIGIKDSTAYHYERNMARHVRPALGHIRLDELDGRMIQHLYNTLRKEHDGKKALSPKSIKDIHGQLHCILQQAVRLNYIRTNPTDNCIPPRVFKKEIKPLTDEQMNRLLEAIQESDYRIMIIVFMFTGLRESELLGLMWDCVDFDRGSILIDKQLNKSQRKNGGYSFNPTKNGKSRLLVPAPYVMDLLQEQKELQRKWKAAAGSAWINSGLVFTNEQGRYVSFRALYDSFKKIVRSLDMPDVRIHDLRHTYAVNSLRAGDDIKTVQENLGHATAAFTLDFYGHCTDEMRQASANRMQAFISDHTSGVRLPA